MKFELVMSDDDIPQIMRGDTLFARALTRRDAQVIVDALNDGAAGMRDQILSAVTDAIEEAFEDK